MSKRPRHYAADIIALATAEQRRTALALVPLMWRDWVKDYVADHFHKMRCLKAYRLRKTREYRC